jgi:hypothetical protein
VAVHAARQPEQREPAVSTAWLRSSEVISLSKQIQHRHFHSTESSCRDAFQALIKWSLGTPGLPSDVCKQDVPGAEWIRLFLSFNFQPYLRFRWFYFIFYSRNKNSSLYGTDEHSSRQLGRNLWIGSQYTRSIQERKKHAVMYRRRAVYMMIQGCFFLPKHQCLLQIPHDKCNRFCSLSIHDKVPQNSDRVGIQMNQVTRIRIQYYTP